ncbi:lipopolysaccharide transport periplasmic protein LptA [Hydrogenophaga palleronii]|uniref:lipopolysaccharide transport periplasmic protein LptA n=1 Tax=Hydrogenophaga palleronii TaxID=65655 RepID=UPI000824F39F|nr:lipopolysaccharide transport periplasmic protein LptA [Hydrogenophaga palleronii]
MPASTTPRRAIPWLLCLSAALWCASAAQAEKADRNMPLNAEADALRHDDARQTSVFTGNVVITKGTIIIRGDQVEVRQDPQGNQFGIVHGKPGFFRQKRDLVDEFIEGTGTRIDYDGKNDTVRFTGNAVLKRFKGTQLNDETTGNVIVYNNTTDVFTVDGGPANRTAANPTGRVRAMLTPVPKEGAAPPAVPAAPATLKPSPQLEETRP